MICRNIKNMCKGALLCALMLLGLNGCDRTPSYQRTTLLKSKQGLGRSADKSAPALEESICSHIYETRMPMLKVRFEWPENFSVHEYMDPKQTYAMVHLIEKSPRNIYPSNFSLTCYGAATEEMLQERIKNAREELAQRKGVAVVVIEEKTIDGVLQKGWVASYDKIYPPRQKQTIRLTEKMSFFLCQGRLYEWRFRVQEQELAQAEVSFNTVRHSLSLEE